MVTENREEKISKTKTSERSKDNENQRPDIEEKRVWTDLPWLIVFLLMTVAWLVVMVYSLVTGNPARLSLPTNSLGELCGGPAHPDRPHLLYWDITRCAGLGAACPTKQVTAF